MALFNFEQRGGAFFNQSQLQVSEPADSNGTSVANTSANALTGQHASLNVSPGGAFNEQPRQNTYDEQLPFSTNGADQFSRHSIRTAERSSTNSTIQTQKPSRMKRSSRSINEEINTYGVKQGNENSRLVFDANQSLPVNSIQNEIPRAQKRSAVNSAQDKGFRVPMPKPITKSTQSVSGSDINATRSDTSNSSSNTAHSINSNGGSPSIDTRPMRNNTNVRTEENTAIGKILSYLATNLTSNEDKYNKQIRWLEQALNSEKLKKQEYFQSLGSMKKVNDGLFERLDHASEKLKGLEKRFDVVEKFFQLSNDHVQHLKEKISISTADRQEMVKKEECLKKELEQMVLVEAETKDELGTLRTEFEFKSKEYSTLSATLAEKDMELNSLKESYECSISKIQGLEENIRNHVLEAKDLIEKFNCEAKANEEKSTRLENEKQEGLALIENLRLESVQIREQYQNCSENLSEAIITVKDLESRCSTQAATIQSKQVEIDRLREELGTIEQVANEKNLIIQKLQIESENLAAALKDSVESSVSLQSIQDKLGELMSLFGSHQPFVQDDLSRISSDLIRSVDECVKSESQKLAETIISVANKNDSSLKIQQQDEIERLNTQIKQLEKHNNDLLVKVTYFNQHAEEMAEASKKYQSKKEKLTVDLENKLHQQRSEIDTLKTKNALLQQQCNALENSKQTNLERSESNMVSFNERTVDRIIIDNDPLLGYLVEARTPAQTPKLGTHAKHTKTNVPPASNPTNKPARKDSMESVDFDVKVTEWQKEIAKPAKKMPENNPLGTILKRKSIFESRSPQKPHSIVAKLNTTAVKDTKKRKPSNKLKANVAKPRKQRDPSFELPPDHSESFDLFEPSW